MFDKQILPQRIQGDNIVKPLVSIIVPIYQTEKYLPRCLDSLQRQSLTNIEILLIDDDSPDKCGEICDKYAAKDKRFKVLHQKHAGTSVARNLGIRKATSEYLMFVDSDDWVHEDFCKDAYECAISNNADIVKFGMQRVVNHNNLGLQFKTINALSTGHKTREELIDHQVKYGSSACDKLFQKSLFDKDKFPEGYDYEDIFINIVIYNAKYIYSLNKVLYYYSYRPGSTTTLKTAKVLSDWFEMHCLLLQNLSSWDIYPPEKIDLEFKRKSLTYCIIKEKDLSDSNYLFASQTLLNTKTIPEEFTWKQKILFFLFKYCPPLFDFICDVYGTRSNQA